MSLQIRHAPSGFNLNLQVRFAYLTYAARIARSL
jgi:hypothetical protein|tara:strand:+ start:182 stop:283 length:102 start_codon:yes stop_codon:yes gene_type:complete